MDTINERKEQPKPEAVRLEQRFQLIKPEHLTPTVWRDSPNQGRGFSCPINLESFPGNSSISFDIHLSDTSSISPDWITPFNPDTGYNITNEDLNPKNRYAKLRRLDIHTPKIKNGFDLSFSSKGELPKNEDVLKELQRLRIHLFFPDWGGVYESQPAGEVSERKTLEFSHFYPLDTGHLPQLPDEELVWGQIRPFKGHVIGLPKDMNKLSQIQAAFVLDPRIE